MHQNQIPISNTWILIVLKLWKILICWIKCKLTIVLQYQIVCEYQIVFQHITKLFEPAGYSSVQTTKVNVVKQLNIWIRVCVEYIFTKIIGKTRISEALPLR